jgi:hypothetical protein
MATAKLEEFVAVSLGQKEVSLCIAKDASEVAALEKNLVKQGFTRFESPLHLASGLVNAPKAYAIIGAGDEKDAYDFVAQYPTGQIELFEPVRLQTIVTKPRYAESAVAFVIPSEILRNMQTSGKDILSAAGLVFRTK